MSRLFITFTVIFLTSFSVLAQNKVPHTTIQDLEGNTFNTEEIKNDGKPIIINFWATWCAPCKRELNTIAEEYVDWIDETGVKLYAVSIDDERSKARVKPYVNGQSWDYEILLDPNSDFRRALNVNNPPHTFVLNGKGEVVWQHNGYQPGDEEELFEIVQKVAKGESIK